MSSIMSDMLYFTPGLPTGIFSARFRKFGISEYDLALKFIYCLPFFHKLFYLLFGIRNFEIY